MLILLDSLHIKAFRCSYFRTDSLPEYKLLQTDISIALLELHLGFWLSSRLALRSLVLKTAAGRAVLMSWSHLRLLYRSFVIVLFHKAKQNRWYSVVSSNPVPMPHCRHSLSLFCFYERGCQMSVLLANCCCWNQDYSTKW